MIRLFERAALDLLTVLLGLIPAKLFTQFDNVADDDKRGRLESGLLGQRRQRSD